MLRSKCWIFPLQFSDISSDAGDDIGIISRKVEEYTVSTESRQVIEEMEVAVGSTSLNYHIVTSAKETSSTCYEASTELMSLNCPSLTLMDSSSAFSQQSEEASTSSARVFSASIRLQY
jgi:hypothetical protein